jgi:uncharacterized protein YjbI with pentapeptide repeats
LKAALKMPAIRGTLAVLAPIAVIATVTVVVKWAPQWLAYTHGLSPSDRAAELGRVRTSLVAILAVTIASVGAVYTARTFALNRQGQITERFTRAIDQLGHTQIDVSLGGIYALERIARESKVDHGPVMEILTGYVREHSPWPPRKQSSSDGLASDSLYDSEPRDQESGDSSESEQFKAKSHLPTDIEAALSVIARRRLEHDEPRPFNLSSVDLHGGDLYGTTLHSVDLTGANLTKADLTKAYLTGAYLTGAMLAGAYLIGADLTKAYLTGAYLTGAMLAGADLTGAYLAGADLTGAYLAGADLTGAYLTGADLIGADLEEANLGGADLIGADLTGANLTGANLTTATLRGANLTRASLSAAHLTKANLARANFTEAALSGADLAEATYSETTIWPAEFDPVARGARRVE